MKYFIKYIVIITILIACLSCDSSSSRINLKNDKWKNYETIRLDKKLLSAKNTTEILTKNVALFAVASTMYLVCGYNFMYDGGLFLSGVDTVANLDVEAVLAASAENGFDGDSVYSGASDFFFQVVFVATAMSIVSGAVAERMKLWSFLLFAVVMTGVIYPIEGG